MRHIRLLAALPLLVALAGCPNPNSPAPGTGMPYGGESPAPGGGLNNLVKEANQAEAELAENLNTPLTFPVPVRLGLLFFDYQAAMKPEDKQTVVNQMRSELATTGLVANTIVLPDTLVKRTDSLETIRKLVSRFQIDTLLIVSGTNSLERAAEQPLGFFDQFSDRAYYEARTGLTALGMNVLTGRFLPPFQTAGKAGPTVLDPTSANFRADAYALEQEAEKQALLELKNRFVTALQGVERAPVPTPSGTTSPSPTPTPEPSVSPDAAATGEATATGEVAASGAAQ